MKQENLYVPRFSGVGRILRTNHTSCTKATANQLRLFLHADAYWTMWGFTLGRAQAFPLACFSLSTIWSLHYFASPFDLHQILPPLAR